jgi:hypothetical protein
MRLVWVKLAGNEGGLRGAGARRRHAAIKEMVTVLGKALHQ